MSIELEVGGAASVGSLTTKQTADLSGQACKNCGKPVEGRYCEHCGQLAASFHRPIWALISETVSDSLALDGRLARTLPMLFFRPGRLTRNYTEGKRARYVPPFRLFLLASLVFYFSLFALAPPGDWVNIDEEAKANIEKSIAEEAGEGGDEVSQALLEAGIVVNAPAEYEGDIQAQILNVLNNQDRFAAELEKWLPRLSILLVPLTILAFAILHVWRRELYIYDHAIHALHLHSWMYLTGTAIMLIGPLLPGSFSWIYVSAFIVYVWRSLMVTGATGIGMSALRLFLMLIFWTLIVTIIIITTLVVSGMSVQA